MTEPARTSRHLWEWFEPIHAVVYFAPEVQEALTACGLRGFWMGYFGSRAAPLGPVGPEVVGATFFGFHPTMVARAIPDAWQFARPDAIQAARDAGVDAALRRILGARADAPTTAAVATQARAAVAACTFGGRPLAAAWAAARPPESPLLQLWHAVSVLREHRGDGHVVANVAAGIDGLEAHVLQAASGAVPRDWLQRARGWTDDDWTAAAARLQARGWIQGDSLTPAGALVRAEVERVTDELAAAPWSTLGPAATAALAAGLRPLTEAVIESGEIPFPNPIGVPRPSPDESRAGLRTRPGPSEPGRSPQTD